MERSGIEDIIPCPPNTRLFSATYPFSCASHYQIFTRNQDQDHRAHWTHFGCLANVLVYSAIYSPTSSIDGQDQFFSPTARRFEQFSCPDCNAPLRPEIISHGACRSFSAGRVFPFGSRYPIDALSPQENDLVDGYPPPLLGLSLDSPDNWRLQSTSLYSTKPTIFKDIKGCTPQRLL